MPEYIWILFLIILALIIFPIGFRCGTISVKNALDHSASLGDLVFIREGKDVKGTYIALEDHPNDIVAYHKNGDYIWLRIVIRDV